MKKTLPVLMVLSFLLSASSAFATYFVQHGPITVRLMSGDDKPLPGVPVTFSLSAEHITGFSSYTWIVPSPQFVWERMSLLNESNGANEYGQVIVHTDANGEAVFPGFKKRWYSFIRKNVNLAISAPMAIGQMGSGTYCQFSVYGNKSVNSFPNAVECRTWETADAFFSYPH